MFWSFYRKITFPGGVTGVEIEKFSPAHQKEDGAESQSTTPLLEFSLLKVGITVYGFIHVKKVPVPAPVPAPVPVPGRRAGRSRSVGRSYLFTICHQCARHTRCSYAV